MMRELNDSIKKKNKKIRIRQRFALDGIIIFYKIFRFLREHFNLLRLAVVLFKMPLKCMKTCDCILTYLFH